MTTVTFSLTNPYVGPRAFQTGEMLYGREREKRQILDLLIADRILLLYSPSGAGKTSLVQAGIIPVMRDKGFKVFPSVRLNAEPPDTGPAAAPNRYVHSALLSLEKGSASRLDPALLNELSLEEYLAQYGNQDEDELLFFDQFEEVLSLDPNDLAAKEEFMRQFGAVLRDRRRWALIALREDFVAGLDPYLSLLPTRLKTRYRLDLLREDQARQAMQEPACALGVTFTDAAAEKLVDDLRSVRRQRPGGIATPLGPYVEPVQLQVVCFGLWERQRELWEKRPLGPPTIDVEDVTALGNVDNALADYYVGNVRRVAEETQTSERAIREWFDGQLITEQGFRNQVLQGPRQGDAADAKILRTLVAAHIIRPDERRGATWYELAHDRLIEPIQASNRAWREANLSTFQRQAAVWDSEGRHSELLALGRALREAERWADEHPEERGPVEGDFLDASRKLEQARARRGRGLLRTAAGALGVLLVALIGALLRDSSRLAALTLLLIVLFSLLPGWLYLSYVRNRGQALYDEYVLNLYRLGVDEVRNLPAPPPGSAYYDWWTREADPSQGTPGRIYVQKFEELYGKSMVRTLDVSYHGLRVTDRLQPLWPIMLATLVFTLGWTLALTGDGADAGLSLFFTATGPLDLIVFGFLGSYSYALSDILRRYLRGDLTVNVYLSIVARVLIVVLAVVLLMPLVLDWLGSRLTALLAFALGFFPVVGIQVVQKMTSVALRPWVPSVRTEYPLSDLDGLNVWYEARLLDEGVEDMHNLITANIVELLLRVNAPVGRLVDWIDQAFLWVHLPPPGRSRGEVSKREALRRLGIRTATGLETAWESARHDHRFQEALGSALVGDVHPAIGSSAVPAILRNWERMGNFTHVRAYRRSSVRRPREEEVLV